MPKAARVGDNVKQDAPHCHAPIHPSTPTPTPQAHPAQPLAIEKGASTVVIEGKNAARVGDKSVQCALASCSPGGPGVIAKGSGTVMIEKLPAARVDDVTAHAACSAPIPSLTGKVTGPGATNVDIGG
ncbi:MAG: PAAR domain-containing protein [Gemmataceae bacterium]